VLAGRFDYLGRAPHFHRKTRPLGGDNGINGLLHFGRLGEFNSSEWTNTMHKIKALCTLATFLYIGSVAFASADKATVDTGILRGSVRDGVVSFKGIPYASPPVGDLRWRPPQPVTAWSGVRSATEFGHDCMQLPAPSEAAPAGTTTPSEDCLVLNIWAPAKRRAKKAAVMVWIHGGGFLNGGSSATVYDGSAFARNGVVFVTFNYRLGRFGFFAHPALTKENPAGPLGNYTYMDEIAVLKWVQRNIAAFGGDPSNVTVFGESAGGGSVHFLLNAPMAKGLFSKAIVESGGGRDGANPRRLHGDGVGPDAMASGESLGATFAKKNGITGADNEALAALRNLPPDALVDGLNIATRRVDPSLGATFPGPMIDGQVIVETAQAGYLAGTQMKVPIMIGANDSDAGYPQGNTLAEWLKPFGDNSEKARIAYNPDGSTDPHEVGLRIARDKGMLEPTRFAVRLLSSQGQLVYAYRFSYVAESMRGEWVGAPHASEVPYVFDTVDARYGKKLTPGDEAVAKTINAYWVAFAKTGNPTGKDRPVWPVYDASEDILANFTDHGVLIQPDPLKIRLDLTEQTHHAQ
jgi:para-nitrobenzyl esterase